jgi:ribosome-binding factor A
MSSTRQLKYAGLIKKDLSEIFQRDAKHWIGNAFLTIADVEVSPDLAVATVYISLMMVEDKEAFMDLMTSKKGEIRKALGLKIGKQVRIVPDLIFNLDHTQEEAQKMDKLLDSLDIPSSPEEE